jgi:hypothetical protein
VNAPHRRLFWLAVFAFSGASASAQGFRITGSSLANFVELRPVAEDSISDSLATGSGLIRQSAIGLVSCPQGQTRCYYYRSLARTHTVPLTQDVEVTGWGLGEGVSVYAHVRAHAHGGGVEELWTRSDDRFTALAAYVELERDRWSARAGRQWLTSQLGINNFDGVSLALRSAPRLTVEGYAGSSLIQGLSEPPTSSVLAAADVLPPDVRGIVVGGTARWRATSTFALGAEYQREIRSDRAGFYSERVAFDGVLLAKGTSFSAEAQADLASRALNELRLHASRPLSKGLEAGVEAVHSTPFFPLWTVWGVFSPVGYNEARANARWRSEGGDVSAALSGGYRRYEDTHTGVGFLPLRNDGWTTIASGSWRARPSVELRGSYRRDIGFGASKSDGDGGIRWQRNDGGWLGITASALQSIYEFRIANGYLVGASVDGALPITPAVRMAAQVGLYRQIASDNATTVNWSQRRAFVRLDWAVGRDPGMNGQPSATGARQP